MQWVMVRVVQCRRMLMNVVLVRGDYGCIIIEWIRGDHGATVDVWPVADRSTAALLLTPT